MPSFPKPNPPLDYSVATEKRALNDWFLHRNVPESEDGKLLLASWNVANLGEQRRSDKDLKLVAHLLARFDLIAVQEIKADRSHFVEVVKQMGPDFDWIINDPGGNNERLGFIFRTPKVKTGKMFAEVAIPRHEFPRENVVVPYRYRSEARVEVYYDLEFTPFDRNPFVATFEAGKLNFTIANVHLYFGAFKDASRVEERAKYARRVMEVLTLARWANKRHKSIQAYDQDVIILGDMNVPEMDKTDPAFRALLSSGLEPVDYFGKTGGSNLAGTKSYDQLAITPGEIQKRKLGYDIFDFDSGVFRSKWIELSQQLPEKRAISKFNQYVRFHMSDHRPLWLQLDIT